MITNEPHIAIDGTQNQDIRRLVQVWTGNLRVVGKMIMVPNPKPVGIIPNIKEIVLESPCRVIGKTVRMAMPELVEEYQAEVQITILPMWGRDYIKDGMLHVPIDQITAYGLVDPGSMLEVTYNSQIEMDDHHRSASKTQLEITRAAIDEAKNKGQNHGV